MHPLCKITIVCVAIGICVPLTSSAQWTEVDLPRPDYLATPPAIPNLGPFEWADSLNGFVFEMNGSFYRTQDGGESWLRDSLNMAGYDSVRHHFTVRTCDFANASFGVVTIARSYADRDSLLFITTDGGSSWERRPLSVPDRYKMIAEQLLPLDNGNLIHFLSIHAPDSLGDYSVRLDLMRLSTDRGKNWSVFSIDTVDRRVSFLPTRFWIRVDSLHYYKIEYGFETVSEHVGFTSYSADGGQTWIMLKHPYPSNHPLYVGRISGSAGHVARVNDTGIVVSFGGRTLVTRDVKRHYADWGWIRSEDVFPETPGYYVTDMSYIDGWLLCFRKSPYNSDASDTVWIANMQGNRKQHGFPAPKKNLNEPRLHTPAATRIFLKDGAHIWRFDRDVVTVQRFEIPAEIGPGFEIYPNPLMLRNTSRTLHVDFSRDGTGSDFGTVRIHDLRGRLCAEHRWNWHGQTNHVVDITLPEWLPAGMYLVTTETNKFQMDTKRLILMD
ncbi:T9SS type A sorting domain-containing protein [bacterium]|nr:T9SS type A sorting domain-containing protein [bacterium]